MPGNRGGGANLMMRLGQACVLYYYLSTLGSGSSASTCTTSALLLLHTVTTTSFWHVCSGNEVSDTRIARVGWLRRFVGLADMMICGRDSNTSSALGTAIIANVPLCQMPTARTVGAQARQPRSRAKWEGGYRCGTPVACARR